MICALLWLYVALYFLVFLLGVMVAFVDLFDSAILFLFVLPVPQVLVVLVVFCLHLEEGRPGKHSTSMFLLGLSLPVLDRGELKFIVILRHGYCI